MARIPDYHPDKPFDGLGLRGWCRVFFRSRAATVKQCDVVTRDLFLRLQAETSRADIAEQRLGRMSAYSVKLAAAVNAVDAHLRGEKITSEEILDLLDKAIVAGKQPL